MYKLRILLCTGLIFANLSVGAFAVSEDLAKTLPVMTLPELSPLETPAMSNNYSDMLEELKRQGFGQTKYDPTKPLPLPEVESPTGAGTSAFDVFKETYGDVWNDPERQLTTSSAIPNDQFFAAVKSFGAVAKANMSSVASGDKAAMAGLLKSKLDTSAQWDLDAIKNSSASLLSASEKAAYLAGTGKPAGWSGIVSASKNTPTAPLVAPNPEGWKQGEVYSLLNMTEGAMGGGFFQTAKDSITGYVKDISTTESETDRVRAEVKEKIANGEELTEADRAAFAAASKNEVDAKLQPIVDVAVKLGNKQAEFQDERLTELALDISAAESLYGVGNVAFKSSWGKTVAVKKGSFFSDEAPPVYLVPKPSDFSDPNNEYSVAEGPAAGKMYATFEKGEDGRFRMKPITPQEALQSGKVRLN